MSGSIENKSVTVEWLTQNPDWREGRFWRPDSSR